MKKFLTMAACLMFSASVTFAQDLPQPSPSSTVINTVGLTKVEISYSRPGVKGRDVFGDLVPYGEVWRTGANKATSVTFSSAVTVGGKEVPAGTYALFSIPGKNSWKLILNSNPEQWGSGRYDASLNVAEVDVKPEKHTFVETMQIEVADITDNAAAIQIAWGDVSVKLPFEAPTKELALANIDQKIKEINSIPGSYLSMATYMLSIGENKEALAYVKQSGEETQRYWELLTISEVYAANGEYKQAIKYAEESKKLADKNGNQTYVKRNEKNIAKWSSI
ncbi:DUF2911 domain-containing protein [Aureibacter tunicatorum]|uniref:DUF2911 domain-containing protein n=1 Tax=Aureibacter tunicatorum TaxID=866807 RepID=A0AAE3XLE1_9BACT|nr:DUF2911 domain-containing protein [Aureibacter tunicatorum]MDR6238743.1 hypothetical protein [Aureibacter tunicatorum]BDD05326.1 hypothetical protein AUTU_28090 [Aureibacter tunicatorum]